MRDFIIKNIYDITGRLCPASNRSRYTEYSLKRLLSGLGYSLRSIFIDVRDVNYKHIQKKYHCMVANVYIRLNDEQKAKFATDKDLILCNVPARYTGDDNNWIRAAYMWMDDIVIRYGEDSHGVPYTITFTMFEIDGKRYELHGERIDWSWLDKQEFWAERAATMKANRFVEQEYDFDDAEYIDYIEEQESLLRDAFEDNLDNYLTR